MESLFVGSGLATGVAISTVGNKFGLELVPHPTPAPPIPMLRLLFVNFRFDFLISSGEGAKAIEVLESYGCHSTDACFSMEALPFKSSTRNKSDSMGGRDVLLSATDRLLSFLGCLKPSSSACPGLRMTIASRYGSLLVDFIARPALMGRAVKSCGLGLLQLRLGELIPIPSDGCACPDNARLRPLINPCPLARCSWERDCGMEGSMLMTELDLAGVLGLVSNSRYRVRDGKSAGTS